MIRHKIPPPPAGVRVSDQPKAGEIRLIDATTQEQQEAKELLDAQRAKRRERHARKEVPSPEHKKAEPVTPPQSLQN